MTNEEAGLSIASSVLLIEDDTAVRMSLVRALASEGFEIEGVGVSVPFEDWLKGHSYQVLVVSLEAASAGSEPTEGSTYRRRSSAVDWERIRRIRRVHPGGCLVALTVAEPTESHGSIEGVDAVVEKPVSLPGLIALLNELLHPMHRIQPVLPTPARFFGGAR